jgi:hypothetical protein
VSRLPKIYHRRLLSLATLPEAKSFTELGYNEHNEDVSPIEIGDGGKQTECLMSNLEADTLLLHLLIGLDNRHKIILMLQILRESGYEISHEDCAKVVCLSRSIYMLELKNLRNKAKKFIQSEQ